jgi:adenosylcobinamide-GDP ribazoletransferase
VTRWLTALQVSLLFLTRLPLPRLAEGADLTLAPAMRAFALAGALIGLIEGLAFLIADLIGLSMILAALIAVAAGLLATGALHEDGLADMADGFGGGRGDRERILAIMRDSRIGSFGVAALVLAIGLRTGALSTLDSAHALMALVAAGAVSRGMLPAMMRYGKPARADGLAAQAGIPSAETAAWSFALAALLAILTLGGRGLAALLLATLAIWGVNAYARWRIGGYTGDVVGAGQQAAAILVLLTASLA